MAVAHGNSAGQHRAVMLATVQPARPARAQRGPSLPQAPPVLCVASSEGDRKVLSALPSVGELYLAALVRVLLRGDFRARPGEDGQGSHTLHPTIQHLCSASVLSRLLSA